MKNEVFARPRRSLGQNFLQDENIIRKIVNQLEIIPAGQVVEIGPGRGALTKYLVEKHNLSVIEKDTNLALYLKETFPKCSVIVADGLEFAWQSFSNPNLQIIGNLPYNIASPLIWELVSQISDFSKFVFMVQKEVAQRICAKHGSKTYGALSVWIQSFCDVKYEFTVSPNVFFPKPKVESAIISLTPSATFYKGDKIALAKTIKLFFQMRRKQLGTILRFSGLNAQEICFGIAKMTERPEMLSIVQFQDFSQKINF